MMSEQEIKAIVKKEGIIKEVIGYENYVKFKKLVILFKPTADPHDEPSMGGTWYIDEETKKMGTISLSDLLDYTEQIEVVKF